MTSRTSTPAGRRRAAGRAPARGGRGKTARAKPRGGAAKPKPKTRPARATTPKRTASPKRAARRPRKRSPAPAARPKRGRRFRLPSLRAAAIALVLLVGAAAAGYLGWFRDSSLVAVEDVRVTGVSSPDRDRIEAALTEAADSMTTLHVREDELADAVATFPTVVSVSADTDFPHRLDVVVTERPPALIVEAEGQAVPVAADGTLLRGLELDDESRDTLPVLEVSQLSAGGALAGEELAQAMVLGAAPVPLRPLIEGIAVGGGHGVEVTMRGEIPIRFGGPEQARAKWAAAAAVLADPKLETLSYLDVRVPERPAVGGAALQTVTAEPVPADPAL